jgi:uncharacterized membrane protein YbhN (UPF0104 family)
VIPINKKTKTMLKFAFVLLIIAIVIYTFRNSAGPIASQLGKTSVWVVVTISILAVLYELVEGWVTYSFAKKYNPAFTYRMGVESAFYCCFYRVATLGSGAGVAAIYYLNEKGIEISKGTGMYMMEYVLHKVTIAIFSGLFFVISWGFMREHYSEYTWMLLGGYGITFVVAVLMVLFCCSRHIHEWLLWLAGKMNKEGKFDAQIGELRHQCRVMEDATGELLERGSFVISIILKDLLKFSFWYSIPYFVLRDTGMIALPEAMAITSLSVLLAAVIPAPAGIGSTEFVFTMLFSVIVGTGAAGSATLLYRFATFVLPFVIGAFVVISRKRIEKQLNKHKHG